jgi:hypothetical protein
MKNLAGMGVRDRVREVQKLQQTLTSPNAQFQKAKVGTGKRLSSQERTKLRKDREKEARRRKRETKRDQ